MAQAQAARLLFNIALVCRQHLYLLLHLRHTGALFAGLGLRTAQHLFQCGQLALLLFALRCQQFGFFFGFKGLGRQAFSLDCGVFLARGPLGGLLLELRQALLDAQPAIHDKADFCFQPSNFGAGFVQLALRLVDVIAGSVMRLANGLQIGLNVAQIGYAAFQRVDGCFGVCLDLGLVGFAFGAF